MKSEEQGSEQNIFNTPDLTILKENFTVKHIVNITHNEVQIQDMIETLTLARVLR